MQTLQLVSTETQQQVVAQQIQALLTGRSTTFAQIQYTTKVATAAKHRSVDITKVTDANVQLFSDVSAFTDVYAQAVKRSAANIPQSANADVSGFTSQQNYFEHTPCYSIVQHRMDHRLYLYAIFNHAKSIYYVHGQPATKQEVAQYLTPSAADKLLGGNTVVHNVAHDVLHTVQVRTIALQNILAISACKQKITF